jgi:hypothetical protein
MKTIVILLQNVGLSVNAIEDDKLTLEDLFQQDLEHLHTKFILKNLNQHFKVEQLL